MRFTRSTILGLWTSLVAVVPLLAATMEIDVASNTSIENERGERRILLGLGDLINLKGNAVGTATLTIPLSGAAQERTLELRAYPILSPWSAASADWNSGWDRSGGDIDPEIYCRNEIDLSTGPTEVTLDVSLILTEMADGMDVHGILLTVPPYNGDGFAASDLSVLGPITGARFDVSFRGRPASDAAVRR